MKKLTLLAIILTLLAFTLGLNAASEDIVTQNQAQEIATNFILSNMANPPRLEEDGDLQKHGVEEDNTFLEGAKLTEIEKLYNADDAISGYLVNFESGNEVPGYIVVSADKETSPIVEFSFSQKHPLDQANEKVKGEKYHYLGGIDYAISDDNEEESYVLGDGETKKTNKKELKNKEIKLTSTEKNNNKKQWDSLLEEADGTSYSPIGVEITTPANYESGWQDCTYDWCYGMGSSYLKMSNFSGYSNHCSPTAGTNICKYWTLRDSASFGKLKPSTWTWTTVFKNLYTLMRTNVDGSGTFHNDFCSGLALYIEDRLGYKPIVLHHNLVNTVSEFDSYIKSNINNGRVVAVHVSGDKYYGNHNTMGCGYIRYKYSGYWISHYIMVADGWVSTPDRYIHFQTERNYLDVSVLYPYD